MLASKGGDPKTGSLAMRDEHTVRNDTRPVFGKGFKNSAAIAAIISFLVHVCKQFEHVYIYICTYIYIYWKSCQKIGFTLNARNTDANLENKTRTVLDFNGCSAYAHTIKLPSSYLVQACFLESDFDTQRQWFNWQIAIRHWNKTDHAKMKAS